MAATGHASWQTGASQWLQAMDSEYDLYELYSCFPVVPKMAGDVLGEAALARPSVTGGLSFFGAPLNSYMTHAATAMVRALRAGPDAGAKVLWRAQPGVIGRISHCRAGWCEFDVHGRVGYVEAAALWGVDPGETVE